MSDNLYNTAHLTTNPEYRVNYDQIFRRDPVDPGTNVDIEPAVVILPERGQVAGRVLSEDAA